MKNTIEKIVESVLIQNRIRNYDKKDLELQLQIHPNYPSFQSVTDTLDYFNIDNIAVEVPKEALDQLPKSFISLVKTDNSEEIVSVIKSNNTIELKHSSLKKKKFSFEEFNDIWIPKVIAVEYNAKQKIITNNSLLYNGLLGILLISLTFLLLARDWDLNHILFLTLSIAGVVFSFFAVRESLGIQSQAIHQFCTSVGNTNCGEVINNNSGKIFQNFSLADAGMVFFGSLSMYQLLYGFANILFILPLLGIPFVLYSIYSQAFIIKKWCAICMAIGSLSIGLAILSFLYFSFSFNLGEAVTFLMLSSVFTLGYLYIKERIKENKTFKSENIKLSHFKRDGEIFNHLLSLSEKVGDTATITNEIVLGNPNSEFKIISLTNPMCGYCKGAFEAYTRILKSMHDQVQIVIRLKVDLNNLENQATQIGLRLLEVYYTKGEESFISAYSEWFADRTYSNWSKKYPGFTNHAKHLAVLEKQSKWAEDNSLYYTPASLINGTIYPKKYSYDEFFHFVSMMIESYYDSSLDPKGVEEPAEV